MEKKIKEIAKILFRKNIIEDIGLFSGINGSVLMLLHTGKYLCDSQFTQQGLYILDKNDEILANEKIIFTYCSGLAGIGWLYEYLDANNFIDLNTNVFLEDVDIVLHKILKLGMFTANHDFLHGSTGVAIYFLKRSRKEKKINIFINQFIKDLMTISEYELTGNYKWKSDADTNKPVFDISLSHGNSSIAYLLLKLYLNKEYQTKEISNFLVGTMQYILHQEIDVCQYGSYFTFYAKESETLLEKSRLAWCYGDLGIATTLYQAGKALEKQEWVDKALEILLYAAEKRRDLKENMVVDAGLCHGTSGIGHIFYRMWWNTRLPEFKKAADYWFEQTLKMAYFDDGLAKYKTLYSYGWVNDYSLLNGIAGIGLALLTYYCEVEPTWDECLLLS